MKTLVISNLKGGVAKTATVINIAAIFAKDHGKKVLLIDADSQCNTTEFYGGDPDKGNLAEVLREGDYKSAIDKIQSTSFENVDLLAGDYSLMDLDLTKVELKTVKAQVLCDMVQQLERDKLYDWVIVDCPPAFNAASAAALLAADTAIIPIKLDAFSLSGMKNLMRQIQNMRKINAKLKLGGLLPTMWYKSENILDAEETLRASGLPVYPHIRRTNKVDDMTFAYEPLVVCSPKSAACKDYRKFAKLIMDGGVING